MTDDVENPFVSWYVKPEGYGSSQKLKPLNFLEITRVPKKIDARSLTSMVVTAAKIMPKSVQICYRGEELEVFGLVEYKTGVEAFKAAEKIRMSSFGRPWNVHLIEEPEYQSPADVLANKLAGAR